MIRVLTVLVLIILVANINYYRMVNDVKQQSTQTSIDAFIEHLQIGDLVFFCRKYLYTFQDVVCKTYACGVIETPFYHTGIVIEENGIKKLLSISFYTSSLLKSYSGHMNTVVCSIKEMLVRHQYICRVYRSLQWNKTNADINYAISKLNDYRYFFNPFGFAFPLECRYNVVCSSFIGLLLVELGLMKPVERYYYQFVPGRFYAILENNKFVFVGDYIPIAS